ncbi:unnamed protein product [Prunus armeniaca]
MNKRCRTFFWGRDSTPPIAWKDVCMPKDLGGLGVKLANQFNLAALAKLGQVLCKSLRWVMGNGGLFLSGPPNGLYPGAAIPPHANLLKKMWKLDIPSKVKIFAWMLIRIRLQEAMNNFLFHDSKAHPACCIHVAATVGLGYWQLNSLVKKKNDIPMVIKWHLSPNAGSNNVGENSINVAESIALQDGLDAAIERGWDQIIVEGDSKLVIDSTVKKASPPWSIQ